MIRKNEFLPSDYAVIEMAFASLKEAARSRCRDSHQMGVILRAYDLAFSAHKGIRSRSGEPYILHSIAVARIVVGELGLGYKSICAALLHDVVANSSYTVDDIQEIFGEKIASLVDGMTKVRDVLDGKEDGGNDTEDIQAENFRHILLTLNDDVRVILITLADALHDCRTIEFLPVGRREKLLSESMSIFIPLAHRLGLYGIKSEMENIWLRFRQPEAYNEILSLINTGMSDKEEVIEEFLRPIRASLDVAGISYTIKKRVKTPYSIWHKICTKMVTFNQINDICAVRIIFEPTSSDITLERNECFRIFALVTAIYDYRPDRIRDWVTHPKANGYEALHLTALTKDGRNNIEVQIRSRRMDEVAEKGIAAHWNYKRHNPVAEESPMDKWIAKVKDIIQNPDINSYELFDIIQNDLTGSEIMVIDSKGKEHFVPKGATALDFGFLVSPESAKGAIAAKINYKLCPISQVLRPGDKVELVTSRKERPKAEWLDFLRTEYAIQCVKEEL